MKKIFLCLLSLCLLASFASCQNGQGEGEPQSPSVSADTSSVTSFGWIKESEVTEQTTVSEWYAEVFGRKIVRNALIYAHDAEDGLWHCWLYLGAWEEGDTLSFGADTTEGYTVVINHVAYSEDNGENSTGAFYFTVACDTEPSFDLFVNNESEGMITTHSDVTIKKTP